MSTSLTIYPLNSMRQFGEQSVVCSNNLDFISDYGLFGQIIDMSVLRERGRDDIPEKPTLRTFPIPPKFKIAVNRDDKIVYVRTDRSGEELSFTYAKELKKLVLPKREVHQFNRAIIAFIKALPDETPIILDWSY